MEKGFTLSVRNYLSTFELLVKKLLRDSGLQTVFNIGLFDQSDDNGCMLMASFQGLPQHSGSRKRNSENIFITARLSGNIKNKKLHLTHYGTEIGYFRQTDASKPLNELEPIAGFHYDFDCDAKKMNHPVFHAQPKMTAGDRYLELNKNISHNGYPAHKEIRTIRIPTPQMDIFSAIVMILADHVAEPEDTQRRFSRFLDVFEKDMIKFDLDGIRQLVSQPFFDANPHRVQCWYPKLAVNQNIGVRK